MDLWIFVGFVAVIAFLAAIEKQLLALHKDILETKIKMEFISALALRNEMPMHKLTVDAKEAHHGAPLKIEATPTE